jgi:hypothetical protein
MRMRKGYTLTLANGRQFRFNKKKQAEMFEETVAGTSWSVTRIREHQFKKPKEMKRPKRDELLEKL